MDLILVLSLIDVVVLGAFAIYRTYANHKSLKVQEIMLKESRQYWNSWKERSKDVARKVLEEISTEDLEAELRRRRRTRKVKGRS
jgi:maltooligosyltrehalose synthase